MIKVLSIAGSDPSSGAGIQADLKTFHNLGAFGMAVPAAHTVQSSRGVFAAEAVPSGILFGQLQELVQDIKPDAVKTGMLFTRQNVLAVAKIIQGFGLRHLIVDPVLRSSSGKLLLRQNAVKALKEKLLPLAFLVTPNIPEAGLLSGTPIKNGRDMDFAAGRILDLGPNFVLIKGGHRTGPATDTLYGGKKVVRFSTARKKGEFHGTGCVLSAAVTVFIARGYPVEKAVQKAKKFVDTLLKTARPTGGNKKVRYFQF